MEDRRQYSYSSSSSSRKRKGGWSGEELEMQHQQDVFAAKNKNKHQHQKGAGTLLKDQFQNTEVGQGYQAKHVIRQKQHSSATTVATSSSNSNIIDMSGGVDFNKASALQSNNKSNMPEESILDVKLYLKSKELRDFRKEIEKILSSS